MSERRAAEIALSKLKDGDREALAVIYNCYGRIIFSVALGITENYTDAEDVLQETMIETVKNTHSYKEGTNPKAWVLAMARHSAIDLVRRRKNHLSLEDSAVESLESEETLGSLAPEIMDLLKKLDEDERQIIILRIYAELPFKDVAKAMDISVFAAQKRYQRALKKLKSISGGDFG